MDSVISVKLDLLPATTKNMAIDLFVGNQSALCSILGRWYHMYVHVLRVCSCAACIFMCCVLRAYSCDSFSHAYSHSLHVCTID